MLKRISSIHIGSFLLLKALLRCRANGAKVTSPGNAPGIAARTIMSALKGRRDPAPLQGAKRSVDSGTQGVGLGQRAGAFSAGRFEFILLSLESITP